MSIINQKKKVFGNIAAAKTLTESMPKLKGNSSFPSINNDGDTITFLSDLLKSLVGYEVLQEIITNILVHGLNDFETEIKNSLKLELKSIVSCGINPSLPDFITTTGIKQQVNKVDFTNLMRTNPTSDVGKLLYNDLTPNLINSSDFNTFLFQTIQNDGSVESWPQTGSNKLLTFQYKSTDISNVDPNNTLTIKVHQDYQGKTLTDLNNDYIDSIKLFNTEKLLANIIDMSFGTLSSLANKSIKTLENDARINSTIDKIVNSDNKDIISDKHFTFSDVEKKSHEQLATDRKNGIKSIKTSSDIKTSISFNSLNDMNTNVSGAQNTIAKKAAVTDSINSFSDQVASYTNIATDHKAIKLSFIQELINFLIKGVINSILSPKVVSVFILNFKIIYGPDATFSDPIDFMKKNKNLIHAISKTITKIIIAVLLKRALKEITKLVTESVIKQEIDKNQSNLTQLLSLVGVQQDTLRQIKGLL